MVLVYKICLFPNYIVVTNIQLFSKTPKHSNCLDKSKEEKAKMKNSLWSLQSLSLRHSEGAEREQREDRERTETTERQRGKRTPPSLNPL